MLCADGPFDHHRYHDPLLVNQLSDGPPLPPLSSTPNMLRVYNTRGRPATSNTQSNDDESSVGVMADPTLDGADSNVLFSPPRTPSPPNVITISSPPHAPFAKRQVDPLPCSVSSPDSWEYAKSKGAPRELGDRHQQLQEAYGVVLKELEALKAAHAALELFGWKLPDYLPLRRPHAFSMPALTSTPANDFLMSPERTRAGVMSFVTLPSYQARERGPVSQPPFYLRIWFLRLDNGFHSSLGHPALLRDGDEAQLCSETETATATIPAPRPRVRDQLCSATATSPTPPVRHRDQPYSATTTADNVHRAAQETNQVPERTQAQIVEKPSIIAEPAAIVPPRKRWRPVAQVSTLPRLSIDNGPTQSSGSNEKVPVQKENDNKQQDSDCLVSDQIKLIPDHPKILGTQLIDDQGLCTDSSQESIPGHYSDGDNPREDQIFSKELLESWKESNKCFSAKLREPDIKEFVTAKQRPPDRQNGNWLGLELHHVFLQAGLKLYSLSSNLLLAPHPQNGKAHFQLLNASSKPKK
nr:uncharacterized protein LOC109166476 [Ipomoea batatas]